MIKNRTTSNNGNNEKNQNNNVSTTKKKIFDNMPKKNFEINSDFKPKDITSKINGASYIEEIKFDSTELEKNKKNETNFMNQEKKNEENFNEISKNEEKTTEFNEEYNDNQEAESNEI